MSKMKKCHICQQEIAKSAKVCPHCGAKNGPSLLKIGLGIFGLTVFFGLMGNAFSDAETPIPESQTALVETEPSSEVSVEAETQTPSVESPSVEAPSVETASVPTEYKSALKKAASYAEVMNMSKQGIHDQLTSDYGEGFSVEAADYALEQLVADWNENALKKAASYSETMHMSKRGLYDQLISEYGEQFTAEEAQYAIDHVQVDWNANALAKAQSYQETMAMSPSAIYDQLVSEYGEQFTAEEAQYAIDHLN